MNTVKKAIIPMGAEANCLACAGKPTFAMCEPSERGIRGVFLGNVSK